MNDLSWPEMDEADDPRRLRFACPAPDNTWLIVALTALVALMTIAGVVPG